MEYKIFYQLPDAPYCEFTPGRTHASLITIAADNLNQVFRKMQGENWSPNGEAAPLIESLGLHHTSMSVGDVAQDRDTGIYYRVDNMGWTELGTMKPSRPKGLSVSVYRDARDRTKGFQVSDHKTEFVLVGEGIPEIFEATDDRPALYLDRNANRVKGNLAAYPVEKHGGYCFGGNFVYSSDSRFPSSQPIKIHDRFEG